MCSKGWGFRKAGTAFPYFLAQNKKCSQGWDFGSADVGVVTNHQRAFTSLFFIF